MNLLLATNPVLLDPMQLNTSVVLITGGLPGTQSVFVLLCHGSPNKNGNL